MLGAAFKPGSDDVRDSPALDVAQILHGMEARVTIYDPVAIDNARRACPQLRYAASAEEAAADARVVLLLTEWPEFRRINGAGEQRDGITGDPVSRQLRAARAVGLNADALNPR